MAWGKKLLLSLSVFSIMLWKCLPDGSKMKRRLHLFTFSRCFIQSNIQYIQVIHVFQYVCSLGIEPTTFALLTQCSATEPQEHYQVTRVIWVFDDFS